MAAIPSVNDIRDHLEGYNITTSIMSDAWILDERDNTVLPFWEDKTGMSIGAEAETTEYYSGNGDELMILNRRPVNSITKVEYVLGAEIQGDLGETSYELVANEGILKARYGFARGVYLSRIWPKGKYNFKVTYRYGGSDIAIDVAQAIKKLTCILMLDNIEGRTGGGALSVQAFNRNYGNMGKYSNIRKRLNQQAMSILHKYGTGVIGS